MPSKSKKRKSVPSDELERRKYKKEIRTTFRNSGFTIVPSVSDKEFEFKNRKGDIDDVYIFENIIVLSEYTCAKSENISDHLLKKKVLFDHIIENQNEFLDYFDIKFPTFKDTRSNYYNNSQYIIKIIYCSKNYVEENLKSQLANILYFDYSVLRYFKNVTDILKLSSRFELFNFLGLSRIDIGKDSIQSSVPTKIINGSVLPESYSYFSKGFKVVSFYIDPEFLLERSYVLRKDGWKDEQGLYQRMIIKNKIKSIRKYLYDEKRVFINNIIVTLPANTKLINNNGHTIDPDKISKTMPVEIQIQDDYNIIGLIDGQHRIFAYHEGIDKYESEIKKLREKHNLLVTGIIYPTNIDTKEKIKFESKQFLEINSEQSNAKSELIHSINFILDPFKAESIAVAVIRRLNKKGPLENKFEMHFYDKDKIKTTSIVNYALKPIVNIDGDDSFFKIWNESNKSELKSRTNTELLDSYLEYSTNLINDLFIAVKMVVNSDKWTTDKRVKDRILITSVINGLIICLRTLIVNKKIGDRNYYKEKLKQLDKFQFSKYKSSQYGAMSREIYKKYFEQ